MTNGEIIDYLITKIEEMPITGNLKDRSIAVRYWSGNGHKPANIQVDVFFDSGRPTLDCISWVWMPEAVRGAMVPEAMLITGLSHLAKNVDMRLNG